MLPGLTFNSWSSCLPLPGAGIPCATVTGLQKKNLPRNPQQNSIHTANPDSTGVLSGKRECLLGRFPAEAAGA